MTNQKLRFDVDLSGRWLSAGDQVSAMDHSVTMKMTQSLVAHRMGISVCLILTQNPMSTWTWQVVI
jgi:hypothetical protein